MFGYIYKTTDLSNGKIYVGKHHSSKFVGIKYVGSGLLITRIRKRCLKDGIPLEERLSVEMIDSADNLEELNQKEIYWINKLDSRNPQIGYNKRKGGDCGPGGPMFAGHRHSEETKKKFSSERIGSKNSNYGNRWNQSDELKMLHRVLSSGENNGMFGKAQSENQKLLDRLSHLGRRKMSHEMIFPKYKMIQDFNIDAYINQGWYIISSK